MTLVWCECATTAEIFHQHQFISRSLCFPALFYSEQDRLRPSLFFNDGCHRAEITVCFNLEEWSLNNLWDYRRPRLITAFHLQPEQIQIPIIFITSHTVRIWLRSHAHITHEWEISVENACAHINVWCYDFNAIILLLYYDVFVCQTTFDVNSVRCECEFHYILMKDDKNNHVLLQNNLTVSK